MYAKTHVRNSYKKGCMRIETEKFLLRISVYIL